MRPSSRPSPAPWLVFVVVLAACTFDPAKLKTPGVRSPDGAVDRASDSAGGAGGNDDATTPAGADSGPVGSGGLGGGAGGYVGTGGSQAGGASGTASAGGPAGGASGTGGSFASGGSAPGGNSGTVSSGGLGGGVGGFFGTGGTPGIGGSAGGGVGSGGSAGSGGFVASGGNTAGAGGTGGATGPGGVIGSGGRTGSGGATGPGGSTGSAGATSTGGVSGTGGLTGTGGATGTGGVTGTGGATGTGGMTGNGGATGGTVGTGGQPGSGGAAGTGGAPPEAPDAAVDAPPDADFCTGQADFTPCNLVTTPDRHYDICVEGTCVSPGCGNATCNVPGPHFPLADTDQRLCYDNSAQLACPVSGYPRQDAEYGWDTLHAESERFTRVLSVASQPVVQDNVTGLSWQGCAAGLTGNACDSGSAATCQWTDALAYCDSLNWGGHQDWHLPDPYELHSIVDLGTSSTPAIDTTAFPATPSDGCWSSSSHADAGIPEHAWNVNFNDGGVGFEVKSHNYYARCVRNGSASGAQSTRFSRETSVMDQPVVVDSVTGLYWQGCAAGLTGSPCAGGTVGTYTWTNALGYCAGLNWGGHQDWRLPNAKELGSIVNERTSSPATYMTVFPDFHASYFWSSSSYAGSPSVAWRVYFNTGFEENSDKSHDDYVRCVRIGP
jgi:hypothetical protein